MFFCLVQPHLSSLSHDYTGIGVMIMQCNVIRDTCMTKASVLLYQFTFSRKHLRLQC